MYRYSDVLVMSPSSSSSTYDMDDSSDIYTESGSHYDQSSASSATTPDVEMRSDSMRSASPAPSVLTMTSSYQENAYRTEFGRNLNNYSDVYRLPADEEEIRRLGVSLFRGCVVCFWSLSVHQHHMFREVMGQYPPGLEEIMTHVPGQSPKRCADFGCGSGNWLVVH